MTDGLGYFIILLILCFLCVYVTIKKLKYGFENNCKKSILFGIIPILFMCFLIYIFGQLRNNTTRNSLEYETHDRIIVDHNWVNMPIQEYNGAERLMEQREEFRNNE